MQEFIQKKQTRVGGSMWDLYLWPDRSETYFVVADGENNEVRVARRQTAKFLARSDARDATPDFSIGSTTSLSTLG